MDQGERATDREALATKGRRRKSGGCAEKGIVLIRGDLALRLKGRRGAALVCVLRSEKSAEAIVADLALREAGDEGPNREESEAPCAVGRPCARRPGNWSCRWRIGVKPRT